ncbi:MAG: glycosyltransferase family 2 protein, partial [Bacteroidota bacterium]
IRAGDEVKKQNQACIACIEELKNTNNYFFELHIMTSLDLPEKMKGVGTARKLAMDEAVRRFHLINRPDGIILALDADCEVAENYFIAVYDSFLINPKTTSASIYFEHPIKGKDYEKSHYAAIIEYELHLRYFKNAKTWAGFPDAFYTVGSSMAVRAKDYAKQGGMPRRQAGEDFYFIHKFTGLGNHIEINDTCIYPSPRISNRVPFGTGKAIGDMLMEKQDFSTYAFETFKDIKQAIILIMDNLESSPQVIYKELPKSIQSFESFQNFEKKWIEIKSNTSNSKQFKSRFFKWWNAFWVMKYAHFCRDHFYPNVPTNKAALELLETLKIDFSSIQIEVLEVYRKLDKKLT